jgi:hypothetical protein
VQDFSFQPCSYCISIWAAGRSADPKLRNVKKEMAFFLSSAGGYCFKNEEPWIWLKSKACHQPWSRDMQWESRAPKYLIRAYVNCPVYLAWAESGMTTQIMMFLYNQRLLLLFFPKGSRTCLVRTSDASWCGR